MDNMSYDEKLYQLTKEKNYWQRRCQLAEKRLEVSPCDPDITDEQIEARRRHREWMANPNPAELDWIDTGVKPPEGILTPIKDD